jgi:hypothetical protein
MIRYFAQLRLSKLILWCYLAWWFAIVVLYFDPSPVLWVTSVGLSFIIGVALNLGTRQASHRPDRWVVFRLFLTPFCVSSYSALIKGKGFILLFPPDTRSLLIGTSACLAVIALHLLCRLAVSKRVPEATKAA